MSDFVLVDGDQALFQPAFGAATVAVKPGRLSASGPMRAVGKKACVSGDEGSVSVAGCPYVAGAFTIPGTGTLEIAALGGDQLAPASSTGSVQLMVKGGNFQAKFTVQSPAMQPQPAPAPPTPDPVSTYSGAGSFATVNGTVKAG